MARKLLKKQLGPWCSYCAPGLARAEYRDGSFKKFACADHEHEIDRLDEIEARMNAYQTEGERQAVGRYW